jgi:hypothetical protein
MHCRIYFKFSLSWQCKESYFGPFQRNEWKLRCHREDLIIHNSLGFTLRRCILMYIKFTAQNNLSTLFSPQLWTFRWAHRFLCFFYSVHIYPHFYHAKVVKFCSKNAYASNSFSITFANKKCIRFEINIKFTEHISLKRESIRRCLNSGFFICQ